MGLQKTLKKIDFDVIYKEQTNRPNLQKQMYKYQSFLLNWDIDFIWFKLFWRLLTLCL